MANKRSFDLNIEKILEDWDIHHGIREIIANAIDEQKLTSTEDILVFRDDDGYWHIRDFGRGLKYEHLTQNENEEKLKNPNLIGKFGIGLKDALATFDRNKVFVLLKSKYVDITIEASEKHGFEDIVTLHAVISQPSDSEIIGTDVILGDVSEENIEKAKALFLRFSSEELVESTDYGDVYKNTKDNASIYINGVKVAEEEKFLFSYNITSLTSQISKALNRERTNVGRNAYRDRVMKILLSCRGENIAKMLIKDLQKIEQGMNHDELSWIDVQKHAVRILSSETNAIFFTSSEIQNSFHLIDDAKSKGLNIITIPDNLREKIHDLKDLSGNPIRDINQFIIEDHESFEFKFINLKDLKTSEKKIFNLTNKIFELIGGKPRRVKEIRISETMRKDTSTFREVDGLWESATGTIIVKRNTLTSIERFSGTLIHEVGHCTSGREDITREFELELTRLIGIIVLRYLNLES
ncbi:hypothetical protein LCGC14_1893130 [marine sediment metagenome]|uniref:MPN635 N-terminal domain-containing protein n=1 Tax=marine sediment metagenome TaxID=412755 RepID=A0A0F9IWX3_9ZZZZ